MSSEKRSMIAHAPRFRMTQTKRKQNGRQNDAKRDILDILRISRMSQNAQNAPECLRTAGEPGAGREAPGVPAPALGGECGGCRLRSQPRARADRPGPGVALSSVRQPPLRPHRTAQGGEGL